MHTLYYCFLEYRITALIPKIAAMIEAPDLSKNFKNAFNRFYEGSDSKEQYWKLCGKSGSISVKFEQYESYLHFNIYTDTEAQKQEVGHIVQEYLNSEKEFNRHQ